MKKFENSRLSTDSRKLQTLALKTAVKIPYLKHYIFCFDIFQVCVLLDYQFLLPVTRVSPRIY